MDITNRNPNRRRGYSSGTRAPTKTKTDEETTKGNGKVSLQIYLQDEKDPYITELSTASSVPPNIKDVCKIPQMIDKYLPVGGGNGHTIRNSTLFERTHDAVTRKSSTFHTRRQRWTTSRTHHENCQRGGDYKTEKVPDTKLWWKKPTIFEIILQNYLDSM